MKIVIKTTLTLLLILFVNTNLIKSEPVHNSHTDRGYSIGDEVKNFKMKNIDEKYISLSDYKNAKGLIIIFTCNTCPYAVAYEERLVKMNNKYKEKGFPLITINPNNPEVREGDSFENMKVRAKEKGFNFPYLFDDGQKVYPKFGATKTPHAYVLSNSSGVFTVEYIGAIDDNYKNENKVKIKYIEKAVNQLLKGEKVSEPETRAIGCSIKK
jgi:peroxiredoxin